MQFSIVIPVYNEAGSVLPLVAEVTRALTGAGDWELIYVDDGSTDGTAAELQRAGQQCPALRVLRHAQRCGQSSALLNGVRAARGTWILTLDGDGQNDPADIPLLIARLCDDGDDGDDPAPRPLMLVGHRTRRRDDWLRRQSSRIANAVRARLLGDGTPDTGCGLKLFSRELFLMLPAFDHMHRFLPALAQRHGARVESVPVRHRPRQCGESKYGIHNRLWAGLVDLLGVMWLQRRSLDSPLRKNGCWSRPLDALGVYWLQRRPCAAALKEND